MKEVERSDVSRRTALKSFGIAVAGGVKFGSGTVAAAGWQSVGTPIDSDVNDVIFTATSAFAVADNGIVLERSDEG